MGGRAAAWGWGTRQHGGGGRGSIGVGGAAAWGGEAVLGGRSSIGVGGVAASGWGARQHGGAWQYRGPFSLHAIQGPVEQTPQLSVRLWPHLTQLIPPQPLSQSPVPCRHLPLDEPCLHISGACFETAWLAESHRSRDWMPGLVPVGQHRLWRRGLRRPQAEPLRGIFKQRAPDASWDPWAWLPCRV